MLQIFLVILIYFKYSESSSFKLVFAKTAAPPTIQLIANKEHIYFSIRPDRADKIRKRANTEDHKVHFTLIIK